jgi:hypothetical protein
MPLKSEQLTRKTCEHGVGRCSLRKENGQHADLRRGAWDNLGAKACGEQLDPQAGAEEG